MQQIGNSPERLSDYLRVMFQDIEEPKFEPKPNNLYSLAFLTTPRYIQ